MREALNRLIAIVRSYWDPPMTRYQAVRFITLKMVGGRK